MPFPWMAAAALGAAGLGVFGSVKANKANKQLARESTRASDEMAQKQMDFQERMSNTAYRRAMADMTEAGLNPILAFSQGGATSPGGASGTAATARAENVLEGATSSAMDAIRMRAELKNLQAMNENLKAQTQLNVASAKKLDAETSILPIIRQKELATAPFYELGGELVKQGISSARDIKEAARQDVRHFKKPKTSVKHKKKGRGKSIA